MIFKDFLNQVVCGDCLQVMKDMPDNCIDTVITDPPYGLKFMNKDWDHGVPGVPYWAEILRVAKPGAMCLAFGGTRTYHRLVCAMEDAGWEIRDCIMWIYGSGFPKSLDISKALDKAAGAERAFVGYGKYHNWCSSGVKTDLVTAPTTDAAKLWDGWGTALKPAYEPICVAMKPLDGTFAENALKWGVAGLNIDGGRIGTNDNLNGGTCGGMFAQRNTDGSLKKAIGSGDKGRWPANVIHDGSEEVMGLFPVTETHAGICRKDSGSTSMFGIGGVAGHLCSMGDNSSAARFFYCAKASKAERGNGNNHPTVKPLALMQYLCKLTKTPTGGIVLDPFCGSGSTLIATKELGRDFIGIDNDPDSCRIAEARIQGRKLFAEAI